MIENNTDNKRRIMRLQQVRVESHNIARQVRNNIEKEKAKHVRKLRLLKCQEMENWRQKMFSKAYHDSRNSIFQMGTAHIAALEERRKQSEASQKKGTVKTKIDKIKKEWNEQEKENRIHNLTVKQKKLVSSDHGQSDVKRDRVKLQFLPKKAPIIFQSDQKTHHLKKGTLVAMAEQKEGCKPTISGLDKIKETSKIIRSETISQKAHQSTEKPSKKIPDLIELSKSEDSECDMISVELSPKPLKHKKYTQISDFVKNNELPNNSFQTSSKCNETQFFSTDNVKDRRENEQDFSKTRLQTLHVSNDALTNRVQFYDYNNKFSKEYLQPNKVVNVNMEDHIRNHASGQACIERQLRKDREAELQSLRSQCEERCQKATEREQVYRDYNELTEKLDTLMQHQRTILSDEHIFSNHHHNKLAEDNKAKLNEAIEAVLKRPAIITTDILKQPNIVEDDTQKNSDINLGTAFNSNDFGSATISDSCDSVIISYVNEAKKQISDDLRKLNLDDKDVLKKKKIEKLQNLFQRVEKLREELVREMDKSSTNRTNRDILTDMVQSVNGQCTKRRNLETDQLKANNKIVNENQNLERVDNIEKHNEVIKDKNPLKIVIKVKEDRDQNKKRTVTRFSDYKNKESRLMEEPTDQHQTSKRLFQHSASSNSSSSTSYRSLPPNLKNNIESIINKPISSFKGNAAQSQPELKAKNQDRFKPSSALSTVNPLLAQYIQRLLGMSRNSINELGVSSSDVETPTSSILNTTANFPISETEVFPKVNLNRIQNFIDDNYSLLSNLEDSVKRHNLDALITADMDSQTKQPNFKYHGDIKADKTVISKRKRVSNESRQDNTQELISIREKNENLMQKTAKANEAIERVSRSTQLTDNCTQRIAEITELIKKVRKEKQKIIDTTLTSASENGKNSTEYLELPSTSISKDCDTEQFCKDNNKTAEQHNINMTNETEFAIDSEMSAATASLIKPPLSLSRFGPYLIEEDLPHQLSTILEIDTPVTPHVSNATITKHQNDSKRVSLSTNLNTIPSKPKHVSPPKKSKGLEDDFCDQIPNVSSDINKKAPQQKEMNPSVSQGCFEKFPSIKSYIGEEVENLTNTNPDFVDLVNSIRLNNISIKKFPSCKDYLGNNNTSIPSKSFESKNAQEMNNENGSSDSLESSSSVNIEEELKKRGILNKSFRRNINTTNSNEGEQLDDINKLLSVEIGIKSKEGQERKNYLEWTTTSTSSCYSLFENNADSGKHRSATSPSKTNEPNESCDDGKPLDLRDFLSKELIKRTNTSSTITSSDDSLASIFLRSLLGSMTLSQKVAADPTNDRQKTSTPVFPQSTRIRSSSTTSSTTHLFSGESRISSVCLNQTSKGGEFE